MKKEKKKLRDTFENLELRNLEQSTVVLIPNNFSQKS
jgi:hypothetical protein